MQKEKTSKMRWLVLGFICALYLVTYMDRTTMSIASPSIMKEFGFNKVVMGVIFSCFTWTYAFAQVPGGWLGDKYGPRRVLALIAAYWSLMTMLTTQAVGRLSFMIIQGLFGVGEAGAFPTATRAMARWFNKSERGLVQGVTHSFSRFGAAIVPPLGVYILLTFGWRHIFYIFGAVGIIWSVVFYIVYRNLPEEHKLVNKAELEIIRGLDENGNINKFEDSKNPKVPWRVLLGTPNMWFIMMAYFCYNYCLWFFMTWLPSYLTEFRHFSVVKMGMYASFPLLAGVIGDTVGGLITDKILKKTNNIKFARKVVAIPAMLGSAICLIPVTQTTNPYTAVYCLAASMFFLECNIGPAWAVTMDVGGQYSGTVSGLMNMAGNIGGAMSPLIFGALVQAGSWTAPFYLESGLLTVGALVWFFLLNPEKSVIKKGYNSNNNSMVS